MAASIRLAWLALSTLVSDDGTQSRASLCSDVILRYADLMSDGIEFPPVVVFCDGALYRVVDGFHRIAAAYSINCTEIQAEIHNGTREEAQWYALQCNGQHGHPRTHDDIAHAFKLMLAHPNSRNMSNRSMASHLHVSEATIRRLKRRQLPATGDYGSTRTVTRGTSQYVMNVDRIGVASPAISRSSRRERCRIADLIEEIEILRPAASENGRSIMNVIRRWMERSCTPTEFLTALELVVRRLARPSNGQPSAMRTVCRIEEPSIPH
jgi:hypothetical protein